MNEVELIASHVGLMFKGDLIAQSSLNDLLQDAQHRLVIGAIDAPRAALRLQSAGITCAATNADTLDIPFAPTMWIDPAAVNTLLVQAGFSVFSLRIHVPSLEDIFLRQTLALPSATEVSNVQPAH